MKIDQEIIALKKQLELLKQRNERVEADKAWEISWLRKICIAALTYIIIVLFFYSAQLSQPFINAVVPTIGFVLSTLSINLLKKYWISYHKKKL